MRTRKNVKTLTETEKKNFVSAVLALKKKPSILHPGNTGCSRYDDFVETRRNAASAQEGPAFLPWHREFILQFENELASIDSSVTLPYWDWTDTSEEANPLTASFLGGNGSGSDQAVTDGPFAGSARWNLTVKEDAGDPNFLQRDLGSDSTAPALPTAGLQSSVLSVAIYDSSPWTGVTDTFRWQCQTALNNLVQRFIGGTMDTAVSVNDPVFFLHHANIDRLYAIWQGRHQASSHYLPVAGGQQGQNLNDLLIFNTSGTSPFSGASTPASVVSHQGLGYRYDTEAQMSIGGLKIQAVHLQVLFGMINDAAGTALTPSGQGIRGNSGSGNSGGSGSTSGSGGANDPWGQLSPAARDTLIGLAINELATQIGNSGTRAKLQTAVAGLTGDAGKVRAASS